MSLVTRLFSSHETEISLAYRKQSTMLKNVAQKISEERELIGETVVKDYYNFQDRALEELNFIQSSSHRSLNKIMQEKYSFQNELTEETSGTLKTAENDLSTLKNQVHALFSCRKMDKDQEDSDSQITGILMEAKKDFTKLISEKRSKEKEMFQTLIKFLQQSQKDIRKEIVLFHSVSRSDETFDEENFERDVAMAIERMERMKKNLISAHIFLNRQSSEMEKLQQAVIRSNQKCIHLAVEFDKLWEQSKRTDSSSCRRLEECKIACASLSERIDTNASFLLQQSKVLSRIFADVKRNLTMNKLTPNSLSLSVSQKFEEISLDPTNTAEITWINNIDLLNQKLENLVLISEKSKGKQESLTRTLNNYENFHDLMKSITRSYNTLLRYFVTTLERSQRFHHAPLKQNEERVRNDTETYDKSKNLGKTIEMKGNCDGDVNVWDEVRSELDAKLQNVDTKNVVFLLKDIMQSVRKLSDEEEIISGCIYETDVAQSGDFKEWGNFPSESLLTDVSSDFLVHSSDESTGGLSEITLEG